MAVVTSIDLVAGGAPVHVTVADQAQNPLPPSAIQWQIPGIPFSVTADATGFEFQAGSTANVQAYVISAFYNSPAGRIAGPNLTINVVAGGSVTGLVYLSP